MREAGIVDEDIEPAEILHDLIDHRLHGGEIGDVGLVGLRLAALRHDLGDQRFGLLAGVAVIDRDARALCGEAERDLAPDAARRAGHQSDLALQVRNP